MSDEKKSTNEGNGSQKIEKRGYQPKNITTGDPQPQGGYVPTGTGDNPTNNPTTPPGDE
jgi:hypothetical protein